MPRWFGTHSGGPLGPRRANRLEAVAPAEARRVFQVVLLAAAVAETAADGAAPDDVGAADASVLGPGDHLLGHEVAVAVVDDVGGGAVVELQVRGVVAGRLGAPVGPLAGGPAHGLSDAVSEQAHRVGLVRDLPVDEAAALREVDLVGHPGGHHPVGVGPGVDGAHGPQASRLDDAAHRPDLGAESQRVPAEQTHVVVFGGLDHAEAVLDGERHGLLDDNVLALPRRGDGHGGVKLVGRRDPDSLDVRVGEQLVGVVVHPRVRIAVVEGLAHPWVDVGARRHLELRQVVELVEDHAGAHADPDEPDPHAPLAALLLGGHGDRLSPPSIAAILPRAIPVSTANRPPAAIGGPSLSARTRQLNGNGPKWPGMG